MYALALSCLHVSSSVTTTAGSEATSAQLIDPLFPGGHDRLDLVGVTAVTRLLWMVRKIPAAWRTDPFATLVGYHRKIEVGVLGRVTEDVHGRLLAVAHQVDLLQEHLAEEN